MIFILINGCNQLKIMVNQEIFFYMNSLLLLNYINTIYILLKCIHNYKYRNIYIYIILNL